jgi:1-acyl-sn-glycerol-3-phosphate acyltransferase
MWLGFFVCLPFYVLNKKLGIELFCYHTPRIIFALLRIIAWNIKYARIKLDSPSLIVCNHTHNIDGVMTSILIGQDGPVYFAKKFLKIIPYLSEYIFLDRNGKDMHIMREVKDRISQGKSIFIFPEGTRVKIHHEPKQYQRSVALLARKFDLPIVMVYTNSGYVMKTGKFGLPLLDFSRTLFTKVIEITTYDKIIFGSVYENNKDFDEPILDFKATNREFIDALELVAWHKYREDRTNIFTILRNQLEAWCKFDQDLYKQDLSVKDAIELLPKMMHCDEFVAEICKSISILRLMPRISNLEKDTIFTKYLEKTIRDALAKDN